MYAALQTLDDPDEICTYEAVPSPETPRAEHVCEVVGTLQPRWGPARGVREDSEANDTLAF